MSFARGENYLKCSNRVWETLGDTVLMIRRESLEQICEEAYDWIPKWAYIKGLKPEMYAKSVVNSIVSVLGPPLLAEYTNTSRHPHCLRVSFQADPTSNYIPTIPMIINEGGGKQSITTLKVAYDTIPSRCTRCKMFGHSSAQCPMQNIPPPEKINPANIPQKSGKHILAEAEEEAPMTPREMILIEAAHSAQNEAGYVAALVKSWPPQIKNQATSPMCPLTQQQRQPAKDMQILPSEESHAGKETEILPQSLAFFATKENTQETNIQIATNTLIYNRWSMLSDKEDEYDYENRSSHSGKHHGESDKSKEHSWEDVNMLSSDSDSSVDQQLIKPFNLIGQEGEKDVTSSNRSKEGSTNGKSQNQTQNYQNHTRQIDFSDKNRNPSHTPTSSTQAGPTKKWTRKPISSIQRVRYPNPPIQ
ncbi:hypothetical protein ZOSMA_222G00120 [Zostera marina]|uniref:DUF4283 domain-containing protein n=1 Tax=Zostera marina TaxID=29655 RepID=A0A0K9PLG1_ZOSMR|nr:hypothetical protein ZOSMA_222G00120 [Zostera marina]